MLLINYGIQDGENEYRDWYCDENYNHKDYETGKVTYLELLNCLYSVNEDDFEGSNGYMSYWDNTRLVWIESIQNIDQATLDILRKCA